ncbi:MAG: hypothetical protein HZA16_06940 [Nitrospirae bacterium]|nr:hypothetical protein [Nitrospirota bacterium]
MRSLTNAITAQKKKVFIVDDHCILREGLTHLINSEEDLVICAEADNAGEKGGGTPRA